MEVSDPSSLKGFRLMRIGRLNVSLVRFEIVISNFWTSLIVASLVSKVMSSVEGYVGLFIVIVETLLVAALFATIGTRAQRVLLSFVLLTFLSWHLGIWLVGGDEECGCFGTYFKTSWVLIYVESIGFLWTLVSIRLPVPSSDVRRKIRHRLIFAATLAASFVLIVSQVSLFELVPSARSNSAGIEDAIKELVSSEVEGGITRDGLVVALVSPSCEKCQLAITEIENRVSLNVGGGRRFIAIAVSQDEDMILSRNFDQVIYPDDPTRFSGIALPAFFVYDSSGIRRIEHNEKEN